MSCHVKIKPLVWHRSDDCFVAESVVGTYRVFGGDGWHWSNSHRGHGGARCFPTSDEAKAAAQVDYERRIRSAIEPEKSATVNESLVAVMAAELQALAEEGEFVPEPIPCRGGSESFDLTHRAGVPPCGGGT